MRGVKLTVVNGVCGQILLGLIEVNTDHADWRIHIPCCKHEFLKAADSERFYSILLHCRGG